AEDRSDQAGEAAVIELGEGALAVFAAELRHVPARAGRKGPAAVAEPVPQTGGEEDRRARFEVAAVVEDGVRLADPVGGAPEADRPIQSAFQAELIRDLDPLGVVDWEIRVAGVAAAAEHVLPTNGRRTARPVHAG